MLLQLSMLCLLIGLFGLCTALVRFANRVIGSHREQGPEQGA